MVEKNSNVNKKSQMEDKKKRKIIIILITLLMLFILGTFIFGKYMSTKQANNAMQVAKMICEMEIEQSKDDRTNINPYCIVKVMNYDVKDKVSETDVNFKIEVTPKEGFVLPEYYWKDSEGTIVAQSTPVSGDFKNGVKELKEYKIVFLNSGEKDIIENVDLNLIAVQTIEEKNS